MSLLSPSFGYSPGMWLDQDSSLISPSIPNSPYLLKSNISPSRATITADSVNEALTSESIYSKKSNPIRPFENLIDLDTKVNQLNSLVNK